MNFFARAARIVVLVLALAAISSQASQKASSGPVPIVDLPSNGVIVFGELHGTNEIPAFFADQVEALLAAGRTVHVGLEMTASDDTGLRNAMGLPEKEQHSALLELEQWRTGNDGRNSVAMARMLGRLGDLQSRFGSPLSLFSYDVAPGWRGASNDRDAFMAEVIGKRRSQISDEDYLLVLSGNVHAFGAPGAPWDPDFRSMTTHLKENHPVLSLRNVQSGGEAWVCTPECGPTSIRGADQTRTPGIYLEPFEMDWSDQPVYDGVYFVGELSASEPLPVATGLADKPAESD